MSSPERSDTPRQAKTSRLDSALGAAIVLAYLDIVTAYIDGHVSFVGAAAVCALILLPAGAAGLLVAVSDELRALLPTLGPRGLGWSNVASAAMLVSPLMMLTGKLARDPGLVLLATLIAAAALGGSVFVAAQRMRRPWSILVASAVSTGLFWYAQDSIFLIDRISPEHLDVYWLLFVLGVSASVGLACFVERLLAIHESPISVRWVLAGVATGIVIGVTSAHLPPNYPIVRTVGFTASFLVLMLPFSWRAMPGAARTRYGVLALAFAGVGYLAFELTPFHRTYYYFAHTPLSRMLVVHTGLFARSAANLIERSKRLGDDHDCRPLPGATVEVPDPRPLVDENLSVLLISIDTLRYDHVGYSGRAAPRLTPQIDALAVGAQRYHRAYPQGGWTSISLPSLFWSRYPKDIHFIPLYEDAAMRLYLEDEVTPEMSIRKIFQTPLEEPHPNVVEALAERDIATIAIANDGMTHYFHPKLGFTRGFETVRYPRDVLLGEQRAPHGLVDVDDSVVTQLAVQELERVGERPFFMWLHFFSPHVPHRPRSGIPFEGYEAEVAYVDQQVGEVLDALDRLGLVDKTLVVLLSDHGEAFYEHGYMGHGLSLHEPALRVPLLFRLPGLAGRDHYEEVGLIDVAPTILELLGAHPTGSMSGRPLTPRWLDENGSAPHPVFIETWRHRGATDTRDLHQIGVVHERRKVIFDLLQSGFAFFDLEQDPYEVDPHLGDDADETAEAFGVLLCELARWYDL